jgi:hypothetical protein
MHGLINRAIQCYLRDTFGPVVWDRVRDRSALGFDEFEAMLLYDDALTEAVLGAATVELSRPRDSLLEDLGTYLVSNKRSEGLRRLLRFGGVEFSDFLHSLDDLPDRGRLAVPDLELPQLELIETDVCRFVLTCRGGYPGISYVMIGILRALADDYGALVLLDHNGACDVGPGSELGGLDEIISIELLDQSYHQGRRFDLAAGGGR